MVVEIPKGVVCYTLLLGNVSLGTSAQLSIDSSSFPSERKLSFFDREEGVIFPEKRFRGGLTVDPAKVRQLQLVLIQVRKGR
jgi:hypothetical protein